MSTINNTVSDLLLKIKNGAIGEVIYKFDRIFDDNYYQIRKENQGIEEDEYPVQSNPINPQIFKDERGNSNSLEKVYELFVDSMIDKGAISFYISI